jgi:hypothetical protein
LNHLRDVMFDHLRQDEGRARYDHRPGGHRARQAH